MEKYFLVVRKFLFRHYYKHILLSIIMCLGSNVFFSFRNLSVTQASKIMEMYVCLVGIILFAPLFEPEQDQEIWDLLKSKALSLWKIYVLRLLVASCVLIGLFSCYIVAIGYNGNGISSEILFKNSLSEAIFLGGIAYFVSAISNQMVMGYMAAVLYYVINIVNSAKFGKLALFQMTKGRYNFGIVMTCVASFMIIAGILVRELVISRK